LYNQLADAPKGLEKLPQLRVLHLEDNPENQSFLRVKLLEGFPSECGQDVALRHGLLQKIFIFLLSSIAGCWLSSAGDVRNFSVRYHPLCGKAGFPAGKRVSSTAEQIGNLERHRCRFGMFSVRLGFTCIFQCKASPHVSTRRQDKPKRSKTLPEKNEDGYFLGLLEILHLGNAFFSSAIFALVRSELPWSHNVSNCVSLASSLTSAS